MTQTTEPWREYYQGFVDRTERIPADAFERGALLFEAAHDVYEITTNRLTGSGWDAERALMVGKLFSRVVKDWVGRGAEDVAGLEKELREQFEEWAKKR